MQTSLVMTVIGADKPGLVEMVADLVAAHGGNWHTSRMARLGGHFAGILRVQIPADKVAALNTALMGLAQKGLSVVTHADQTAPSLTGSLRQLEIIGQDRPGIVQQITHVLSKHGANVEELETECVSAAMSGEAIFKAQAVIRVPVTGNVAALKADLEKIASDLIVEVAFLRIA